MPDAMHFILKFNPDSPRCSCGFSGTAMAVLGHALPLTTRALADQIATDPEATPEQVRRAEALAQETAAIRDWRTHA
jgi:hypothetical protein